MGSSICSCSFNNDKAEENFFKKEDIYVGLHQNSKPLLKKENVQSKSRLNKNFSKCPLILSSKQRKLFGEQRLCFNPSIDESIFLKFCRLQFVIKVHIAYIKNINCNSKESERNLNDSASIDKKGQNKDIIYFKLSPTGLNVKFGVKFWGDGAKYVGQMKKASNSQWNGAFNKTQITLHDEAATFISHGVGIFSHSEGDEFRGEFVNDETNGYGIYVHKNGASYEGNWAEDSQNGVGIETWLDGSSFSGIYKDGGKDGIGIYHWKDGSIYNGEWRNNNLEGIGIYQFLDGRVYSGEWFNSSMHGYGEFLWPDGKKYVGFYECDQKSGFGVYLWKNPTRTYLGFWKNGKQGGVGRYISAKSSFWGEWENGDRKRSFDNKAEALSIFEKCHPEFLWIMKMTQDQIMEFLQSIH